MIIVILNDHYLTIKQMMKISQLLYYRTLIIWFYRVEIVIEMSPTG